jgi:hypothetical protein
MYFLRCLSKSENAEPPDEDFIDTDYWADPERKVRRKSGEQDVILAATGACSKANGLCCWPGWGWILQKLNNGTAEVQD